MIKQIFILIFLFTTSLKINSQELRILFGGDTMFDWGIRETINKYGYEKPFIGLKSYFDKSDFRVINLETPIIKNNNYSTKKTYIFTAYEKDINILKMLKVNLVSLGNNHSFDHKQIGLEETIMLLKKYKINSVGAGYKLPKVYNPFILNKNGQIIHFYSVSKFGRHIIFSTKTQKGVASLNLPFLKKILKKNKAKNTNSILLIHWGQEYSPFPSENQRKLAKSLIDIGFKAIIGHHPHIPQGIEKYKNGVIVYSLGNMIFGSKNPYIDHNILVNLIFKENNLDYIEIQPIFGKFQKREPIQKILNKKESNIFLREYQFLCKKLNTKLEIRNSVGIIQM